MKINKKFLIILLVALVFGLLPQINVFAFDNPWVGVDNSTNYKYYAVYSYTNRTSSYDDIYTYKFFYNESNINLSTKNLDFVGGAVQYNHRIVNFTNGTISEPQINYYDATFCSPLKMQGQVNSANGGGYYYSNDAKFYELLGESMPEEVPMTPDDDGSDDRLESMPSTGNGIFITSLKNGDKYNTNKDLIGYPVRFKLKGRYKMDFDLIAGDEADKLQIINSLESSTDLRIINFKWIKSPSTQAFDGGIVEYEIDLVSYFDDIGTKTIDVTLMMDVSDSSQDFETYAHRYYSDSVTIELVSNEGVSDGVLDEEGNIVDNSSDDILDFPSPPDGGSILDWIKYYGELLLWLITYPFRLLVTLFKVQTGYISEMVTLLTGTSKQITSLFTFIPQDILTCTYGVISFTLLYSVIRGIIKMIRG